MSQNVKRVALIMAGGSGERFWPLSRRHHPKQLLKLTSDTLTLIAESVERILPLIPAKDVYIATSATLLDAMRAARLPVPPENIIAEPARRNTAGCLCWGAAELMHRYPGHDVSIGVLTADHLIGQPDAFRRQVEVAYQAAESQPSLVTLGIKPDRPETGYGYIEIASEGTGIRTVSRFREKPSQQLAEEFAASGCHYWNSGMFFWRLSTFLSQMDVASPIHGRVTRAIADHLAKRDQPAAVASFEELPNISIDYALLERAPSVLMVEADFPWDDVGAWDAIERSRTRDENGNVSEGGAVLKDVRDCIVINDAGQRHIAVGVIGVDNLVIIVSKDAVLVVPKDKAQEVRYIPRELERLGFPQV